MMLEKQNNLETLTELDRLGWALGETGKGWFTHVKQGCCEWWTFHLESFVCLVVRYTYTPVQTKVCPIYRRKLGAFDCFLERLETAPSYPSCDGTPAVINRQVLSLEEVFQRLETEILHQPSRAA